MKYKLDFAVRVAGNKLVKADFMPVFRKAIAILKKQSQLKNIMNGGQIHLVLTGDEEIELINGLYRNRHKSTDVISLSYIHENDFPKDDLTGEIMISLDTAKKQAKKHGHSVTHELRFLFAHGLLHVFGYDHLKASERKIMLNLQDEIMTK